MQNTKLTLKEMENIFTKEELNFMRELLSTSTEELLNEIKVWYKVKDWEREEKLREMVKDWEKWARKSIHTNKRKMYMDILKHLKGELEDVRAKNHIRSPRVMGFKLGRNQETDRNTGDTNNQPSSIKRKTVGVTSKRVFSIGRKNKPGQE